MKLNIFFSVASDRIEHQNGKPFRKYQFGVRIYYQEIQYFAVTLYCKNTMTETSLRMCSPVLCKYILYIPFFSIIFNSLALLRVNNTIGIVCMGFLISQQMNIFRQHTYSTNFTCNFPTLTMYLVLYYVAVSSYTNNCDTTINHSV